MSARVKLTPAQVSAVEIYIADPIHEITEIRLDGRWLVVDCSYERASEILIDASNSADAHMDGKEPDRGACTALDNVLTKVRTAMAYQSPNGE